MRSRNASLSLALLLLWLAPATVVAASSAGRGAQSPTPGEIARALEQVRRDPNLATERTMKTLKWREAETRQPSAIPWWLAWVVGLFRWVGESARYVIWVAAVVLAGVLAAYIVRVLRGAKLPRRGHALVIPSHVGDLDIRPESLPEDIGRAARALWDDGRRREALSLLYRGLLSRLAHTYRVPIRESSTEGECLALAAGRLTPRRHDYASRLIVAWQRFVYGSEPVEPAVVYALCRDFSMLVDGAVSESATGRAS